MVLHANFSCLTAWLPLSRLASWFPRGACSGRRAGAGLGWAAGAADELG